MNWVNFGYVIAIPIVTAFGIGGLAKLLGAIEDRFGTDVAGMTFGAIVVLGVATLVGVATA
jgi:hypothetical protein